MTNVKQRPVGVVLPGGRVVPANVVRRGGDQPAARPVERQQPEESKP